MEELNNTDGRTTAEEQIDNRNEFSDKDIADNIISIITKIKTDRSRPCYQNIHEFLNKRNIKLDMVNLKRIMSELLDNGIIININNKDDRDNKESFKVNNDTETSNSDPESLERLLNFVDDKFFNTLTKFIKTEIQTAINNIKNNNDDASEPNKENTFAHTIRHQHHYTDPNKDSETIARLSTENINIKEVVAKQSKEIEFLRQELSCRNKVVEMLVCDKIDRGINNNTTNIETLNKTKPQTNIEGNLVNLEEEKERNNHKRSILILGDSMLKDVERQKVKNGLHNMEKVYVKHFPGATSRHMKSYAIPSKDFDNDLTIIHCGTNDLRSEKKPIEIAAEIIEVAQDLKTNTNEIMLSGIIPRRDKLNGKGKLVNDCLQTLCAENNFHFIDNSNINAHTQLNNSGLHLNMHGTHILGSNFVDAIRI